MQALSARTACSAFQAGAQTRRHHTRRLVVQATSDPQLQRPVARPEPSAASAAPATAAPAAPAAAVDVPAASSAPSGVTVEYQRQQAKAMRQYFQQQKLSEVVEDAKVFGWTKKNEIANGRWVMMGIGIGLMTELATGVSFIDQLKLMASYMGLVDLE